jgi:hypothetical protein
MGNVRNQRHGAGAAIGKVDCLIDPTKNCDPIDLIFAWLFSGSGLAIPQGPCYI